VCEYEYGQERSGEQLMERGSFNSESSRSSTVPPKNTYSEVG
jgi:hypothetical protein